MVVPVYPSQCACVVVPVYSKHLGDNGKRGKASNLPIVPHPLSFFPSPVPPCDTEASAEEIVAIQPMLL